MAYDPASLRQGGVRRGLRYHLEQYVSGRCANENAETRLIYQVCFVVHQSGELEKLLMKEGLVSEYLPEDAPEPKKD